MFVVAADSQLHLVSLPPLVCVGGDRLYRYNTDDRVRLIYQNDAFQPTTPPLLHYLVNILVPEEEAMNLVIHMLNKVWFKVSMRSRGNIFGQMHDTYKRGADVFFQPVKVLKKERCNPMSACVSQIANMVGLPKTRSVYVISPKLFCPSKSYPLVVFCHGYLGSWRLYQGIWTGLTGCVVLSIPTDDLSGIFFKEDIQAIFNRQIPFLEGLGYKIDPQQIHLIGLSNGFSAANEAYKHFSDKFKSITFVSCIPMLYHYVPCQINLVGGGKDRAADRQPRTLRHLCQNGVDADLCWSEDANHFTLLEQRQKIVDFLNHRIHGFLTGMG